MGQDKGWVLLKGKPLIQHLLEKLSPLFENLLIVANDAAYTQLPYSIIADIYPEKGALGGIYTGLKHSNTPLNFFVSVDMPFITVQAVAALLCRADETHIWLSQDADFPQPLFACYPKSLLPAMEKSLHANELKLLQFVQQQPHQLVTLPTITSPAPTLPLFYNVNTPEQLAIAEKMLTTIYVQAFGYLTEVFGKTPFILQGIFDLEMLVSYLQNNYPQLASIPYKIAVNQRFVTENTIFYEGDTIALLPPFSGG